MKKLIILFWLLLSPTLCFGAPTVSNVTGTVSVGQTLTISGSNLLNQDTANWSFTESQGSFEGANISADGWTGDGSYDTGIKLLGNKSFRSTIVGSGGSNCPTDNAFGDTVYRMEVGAYGRLYVYHSSNFGTLWDNAGYQKMIEYVQYPNNIYIQPNTGNSTITQLITQASGGDSNLSLKEPWTPSTWHCVEWLANGASGLSVWVDGVSIGTNSNNAPNDGPAQLGIVNSCPVNGTYNMYLDGVMFSSSRIYPAATIVVGNNSDYAIATKVMQKATTLSDSSIAFVYEETGISPTGTTVSSMSGTDRYLWVIDNRQSSSSAYTLSGGGDTTAPTVTGCTIKSTSGNKIRTGGSGVQLRLQ